MEEYCLWLQNHVHCTLETPKYFRLSDGLRDLKKKWHKYKDAKGWNIYLFLANPDSSGMPEEYRRDYFPEILWKITGAELDAAAELCRIMQLSDSTHSIAELLEQKLIFFEQSEEDVENRNVCMLNSSGEKITVSSYSLKRAGEDRNLPPEKLGGKYILVGTYTNMDTGKILGKPLIQPYDDAIEGMKAMDRLWWDNPLRMKNDEGETLHECMYRTSLSYVYSRRESDCAYKLSHTEEWPAWMVTAAEYILLEAGLTMNAETVYLGLLNRSIFHVVRAKPDGKTGDSIEAELQGKKYSCSKLKGVLIRDFFETKEDMKNGWECFEEDWQTSYADDEDEDRDEAGD